MDPTILAKQVQSRRKVLHLTQDELATKAEISRNYVSMIESGRADNVSLDVLNRLAVALKCSPGQLIGEGGENQPADLIIDPALAEMAEKDGLSAQDVLALARIEYRGRRPASVKEWRELYRLFSRMGPRR